MNPGDELDGQMFQAELSGQILQLIMKTMPDMSDEKKSVVWVTAVTGALCDALAVEAKTFAKSGLEVEESFIGLVAKNLRKSFRRIGNP